MAAKWGKTNMVSLLLEKGANIESKTRDGLTPLHCAARSGHEQVVDMMLERGAPISSKTKVGNQESFVPHVFVSDSHLAFRGMLYHVCLLLIVFWHSAYGVCGIQEFASPLCF